eukprot:64268-Chlamydomonas_euryale.AAC.1
MSAAASDHNLSPAALLPPSAPHLCPAIPAPSPHTPHPHTLHTCPAQVRTDLVDTHIAVCGPEVLLLFSDNFDYQSLQRDFVTGAKGLGFGV